MKKEKKQKEKVTYYDDGSTIYDMSGLRNKKPTNNNNNNLNPLQNKKPRATEREKLRTFFQAFKMMLAPTGVALLILLILYIIFRLLFAR